MRPIPYRSGYQGETKVDLLKKPVGKPQNFHLHTTGFEPKTFNFFWQSQIGLYQGAIIP